MLLQFESCREAFRLHQPHDLRAAIWNAECLDRTKVSNFFACHCSDSFVGAICTDGLKVSRRCSVTDIARSFLQRGAFQVSKYVCRMCAPSASVPRCD